MSPGGKIPYPTPGENHCSRIFEQEESEWAGVINAYPELVLRDDGWKGERKAHLLWEQHELSAEEGQA